MKYKLKTKLMLSDSQVEAYFLEYKKFLIMGALSKDVVSPSEQVDHVWHLHQTYTRKYRQDCFQIFGQFFSHCPALGGKED